MGGTRRLLIYKDITLMIYRLMGGSSMQEIATGRLKKKVSNWIKKETGFLFILPWLIGFIIFKAYPFASSLYYSFTNFHLFDGISKYGLFNYAKIFDTEGIMKAFQVTFKYALITVPLKLVFALFIAYLLNFKMKGIQFFRTLYYIPSILGGSVAIAVLWKFLFQKNGLVNNILGLIGMEGISWLGDERYALFVISLLRAWQFGSAMVIFLAALKNVPEDLYEAAAIDGAGKVRQFISITIPLITPVIFYNLVTQLVQAFQEFNAPFIITNGGPLGSTTLISLLIYNQAFKKYEMGLASAMAWLLFAIVGTMTVVAFISQNKWVYYEEGGDQ